MNNKNAIRWLMKDGSCTADRKYGEGYSGKPLILASDIDALLAALTEAQDTLNELAKDTSSNAIAMQNKAVTGYMRARDSLAAITKS